MSSTHTRLRGVLLTTHRWIGLACALFFVLTVSTGFSLMFQRELGLTGAARLDLATASLGGLDDAIAAVRAEQPGFVPVFLSAAPDLAHAWQLVTTPRSGKAEFSRISSIDPASGRVLSTIEVRRAAASILLKIHTELLSGVAGHLVVLVLSVGLVLLGASGFMVVQRRWRVLSSNPLHSADRWRSVHRWTGLVGALLVVMWGGTGFLLLGRIVLEDWRPPAAAVPLVPVGWDVRMEDIIHKPEIVSAGELFGIGFPTQAAPEFEVTILRRAAAPWRKFIRLRLNPHSGAVIEGLAPERQSAGDTVFAIADSIHKGQSDPLAIHWAYLLAVAFPVVLVVSGPGSWLRRAWRNRRKR